jgi:hypothetical protein
MAEAQDRHAIAVLRDGLVADLIHQPAYNCGRHVRLREKAAVDYSIPCSRRITDPQG